MITWNQSIAVPQSYLDHVEQILSQWHEAHRAQFVREGLTNLLSTFDTQEQKRGPVPKDVHELARSDVPVLLVSGAHDPVTPPEFADRVAKGLPSSQSLVFQEMGQCDMNVVALVSP